MSNPNESNATFGYVVFHFYQNRNQDPVYCYIGSGSGNVKSGRFYDLSRLLD